MLDFRRRSDDDNRYSLILDTEVDGEVYELRFHVVRRKDFKVIIGNGMLKKAAITIEGSDARFKKLPNNEKNIVYCVQVVNSPQENVYSHLLGNARKKIKSLVDKYRPTGQKTTPVKMKIILRDDVPESQSPRRLAQTERQETETQVEEWSAKKIIKPSCSEYASPVIVVRKKGGAPRVCIDYRAINKKVIIEIIFRYLLFTHNEIN